MTKTAHKTTRLLKVSGIIILVVLAILALKTCFDAQRTPQGTSVRSLIIPLENDIQTLDPAHLSDPYTSRVVWQIYEGLLGLDRNGNASPLLAESWESNQDHTEWTFKIRPNVLFHNHAASEGTERTRQVDAEDVVFSYTRFARGFGSFVFSGLVVGFDDYLKGGADTITGFSAPSSHEFRVALTRPDASFLSRLTSPYLSIMPRDIVATNPDEFGHTVVVGTGPFRFLERDGNTIKLERNSAYWQATEGNIDRIAFRVDKNPQLRVSQFDNGVYDLMQVPNPFLTVFQDKGSLRPELADKFRIEPALTYNVHYLGIDNLQIADVHLRRAIAQGVNKEAIVEGLLDGTALVANSPVPPGMQGYSPPHSLPFDKEAARKDLSESSYDGHSLTLLISTAPNSEEIGQLIQSDLGDIGIKIELELVDLNTLITRLFGENRPVLFLAFSEWVFSAPEIIIQAYHSKQYPNPNLCGYSNPEVDQLIDSLSNETDRAAINEICRRIEMMADQEAPAVWLFHQKSVYIMRADLHGFFVNGHNHWDMASVRLGQQ